MPVQGLAYLLSALAGGAQGYNEGQEIKRRRTREDQDFSLKKQLQEEQIKKNQLEADQARIENYQKGVTGFDPSGQPIIAEGFARPDEGFFDAIGRRARDLKAPPRYRKSDIFQPRAGGGYEIKPEAEVPEDLLKEELKATESAIPLPPGTSKAMSESLGIPETEIPKVMASKAGRAAVQALSNAASRGDLASYRKAQGEVANERLRLDKEKESREKEKFSQERKEKVEKERRQQEMTEKTVSDVSNAASNALNLLGKKPPLGGIPGATWIASKIPETESAELAGHIETLKANLSLDKLQQIRQSSPTGGALGNASDKDIVLLSNVAGSLDLKQPRRTLIANINRIQNKFNELSRNSKSATPLKTENYSPTGYVPRGMRKEPTQDAGTKKASDMASRRVMASPEDNAALDWYLKESKKVPRNRDKSFDGVQKRLRSGGLIE